MKKIFYILIFIFHISYSQDYNNNSDAIEICTAIQSNNFSSDINAEKALNQILNVIGASKRFVVQPCNNINNAIAITYNGIRYILYDKEFMESLNNGNNWGNLFILAHEVGHHINGHSVDLLIYKTAEKLSLEQKRQQELEADEFAGFIIAKLGGSLSSCNDVITKISNNSDDSSSTHPTRAKRLNAVNNGFKSAGYNLSRYENLELNYSLVVNTSDIINKWDYKEVKEKEIELKAVTDPFKRMEIINSETPDLKITSWVYGSIIDKNPNSKFTSPKLVIEQEKYNSDLEHSHFNNTSIYLYDSFFLQKTKSLIPKENEKLILEYINNGKFKFEYIFDDGTKGNFYSISLGNKPWMLRLDLDTLKRDFKGNILQLYNKEYSYFIEKLMTQNKIFIRLIELDNNFEQFMNLNNLNNNYSKNIKTHAFDLNGSRKALQLN
jgi:hypothetical protein